MPTSFEQDFQDIQDSGGAAMKPRSLLKVIVPLLVLALGALLWYLNDTYADLPNRISQHETIVLGQSSFVPGSQSALRVVVRDSRDATPLPGASIKVSLQPAAGGPAVELYRGTTDAQGSAEVSFVVPEDLDPSQILIVETDSDLGSDDIQRPVTVARDYRVLLTTDKPLYQPGQVIHVRALALGSFDLIPAAGQDLEIVIADGKGNKVFRQTAVTSEYGVAAVDFQLASQVNSGNYKITAALGNTSSEKTVTVEYYVLPKFAVELTTERSFYLPGEHVRVTLNADYFFGKPVAGGQVLVEGYTFDVERSDVFSLQGPTDAAGGFEFEFDLPGYLVGSDLEAGLGRFYLQATVTDLALHNETSNLSLPVSQNALVIDAIPEGGQFRMGVENILYLLASYPDGTPAECSLSVTFYENNQTVTVETGPYGLAEVRLVPEYPYQQFVVTATDQQGNQAQQEFYFEGDWYEETVLLRPDKPVYRVGETMNLTILTSASQGTVYLDFVREGQTLSTRSIPVTDGRAEVAVDLTPDLYGTLEMHAYKILSWGGITRDTRLVVVDQATDLSLALQPGQDTYRPGDTASLDIQVTGTDGQGAASAVGLAIVDESVFALAEQDPGFAKLYFMLESELLQPKYDLHGFSIPDLVSGLPQESAPVVQAVEGAAQASLAAATPRNVAFGLDANSHQDAMQRAYTRQQAFFAGQSKVLYGLMIMVAVTVFGLVLAAVWREKRLLRSVLLVLGLLGLLFLLFMIWPMGSDYWWVQTPLDRISFFFEQLLYGDRGALLGLLLLGALGYLALIYVEWRRKDASLGWMLGLVPVFLVVIGYLAFSASNGNVYPSEKVILWGVLAFCLLPLAFLVRFGSFVLNKQALPALAALLLVGLLLVGTVPVLALGASSRRAMAVDGGMMLLEGDMELQFAIPASVGGVPMFEPTAAPAVEQPAEAHDLAGNGEASAVEPPRLRQYFPETMLWLPEVVTDENGSLHLEFPVADSITTWRMTALASTQDGRLGSATAGLRVFQDFFIDLDLPLALTVGDEISVPVGIFNYLPQSQTVRLELTQAAWFELLDRPVKEVGSRPMISAWCISGCGRCSSVCSRSR
jgi:hypothetical protein